MINVRTLSKYVISLAAFQMKKNLTVLSESPVPFRHYLTYQRHTDCNFQVSVCNVLLYSFEKDATLYVRLVSLIRGGDTSTFGAAVFEFKFRGGSV